jgi:PAS domain S-box-containing protein
MSFEPAANVKPATLQWDGWRKLFNDLARLNPFSFSEDGPSGEGTQDDSEENVFLASMPADRAQKRVALTVAVISVVVFLGLLPFVRTPLVKLPAFIASYEAALAIIDLIAAILLFGQFTRLRSYALLALACGYLFNTFIVIPHALTFPGLFSATGLLSAGSQSTAWLYVFWHGGFALFVLAFAFLRDAGETLDKARGDTGKIVALSVISVGACVVLLTILSTAGMELLPTLIQGTDFSLLISTGTSPTIAILGFAAFVALCRQRKPTVIELWLRVVMLSWLFDVALSAIVSSSRFDLGWYAGRTYGLTATSFVLIVLLLETNSLHDKLVAARTRLAASARDLELRVKQRTQELLQSNAELKVQISEREQAERKLEGTRGFFVSIIESLPAMLLVKTAPDGKVVLVNSAAEQLLGYERGEMVGKTSVDLFSKQDAECIQHQEEQALSSGSAVEEEFALTTRKLGVRRLRMKNFPLLEEQGTKKYVVALAEDVTAQRQTEEQLFQAQKMESIGHLTGGLAHDFNNLLAVIIGNLDVMAELAPSTPQQAELSAAALEAALSGAELTRRLLAFARRQPLQPEEVDTNALVDGITKLLARTLGEDIKITLDLDPETKPIFVDRVQLETAIANMANNARDAMPGGGQLIIATSNGHLDREYVRRHSEVAPGDYVKIEVTDTGEGMTPEIAKRIFEPFYTTKGVGKGTGLGLSMVFGFVKQSKGHINVYSEPGRGTTFRLYLRPAQSSSASVVVESPSLQPRYANEETVLVVEDNSSLRAVVVRQLEAVGLRVLEAANARQALDVLKDAPRIDLIFTDMVLPGEMDGDALARAVRQSHPDTKIIMTSGFPGMRFNESELAKSLPLLSKPYRKQDLIRMVSDVLNERSTAT